MQLDKPPSLILLQFDNEHALRDAFDRLSYKGITIHAFYEPDSHLGYPPGYTSWCTRPVFEHERHLFKDFSLWRAQ